MKRAASLAKETGVVLSLLLLLTACAGGAGKSPSGPNGGDNKGSPAAPAKPAGPKPGGTLRVGLAIDPPSLDPQRDAGGPSSRVAESVFETLLNWDDNLQLKGKLATSWESAPDGKSITVKLRDGVKFHDGTAFNAAAVKFTFERALGQIGGKKSRYYSDISTLDRVEIVDPLTVKFLLTAPAASFLTQLAYPGHAILSPTAVQQYGEEFSRHIVGTGPFKLQDWQVDQSITLVKNPDYWEKGLPYLDSVVFKVIPDENSRLVALESGQIDMNPELPSSEIARLQKAKKVQVYTAESLRTIFTMFNTGIAPFNEIKVRQAMITAINLKELNETLLEGQHRVPIPTFAPGLYGAYDKLPPYEFDVNKAKQLLDEAGWKAGPNGVRMKEGKELAIDLDSPNGRYPADIQIAERIQAMLAEIGIKAAVKTAEWNTFRDKLIQKKSGFFLFGAGGASGDLGSNAMALWHKKGTYGQQGTPADALLEQAQVEPNSEKRMAMYKEAQEKIRDNYQFMPLYYQNIYIAAHPKVQGLKPHPMEKLLYTTVWLEG